jgi:hypothetical protein
MLLTRSYSCVLPFERYTVRANSFSPFSFLSFLSLGSFCFLRFFIQEESPERAAFYGKFMLNKRCGLKYEKCYFLITIYAHSYYSYNNKSRLSIFGITSDRNKIETCAVSPFKRFDADLSPLSIGENKRSLACSY